MYILGTYAKVPSSASPTVSLVFCRTNVGLPWTPSPTGLRAALDGPTFWPVLPLQGSNISNKLHIPLLLLLHSYQTFHTYPHFSLYPTLIHQRNPASN